MEPHATRLSDISSASAIDEYLTRSHITDVALRVASAVDRRDEDALSSCFTPDAVIRIDKVGVFEGVEAIVGSLAVLRALDLTQHVVANSLVERTGDRATMESYFIATHVMHAHPGGPLFTVGGLYADELRRVAGAWLIVRRTARLLWSSGNAAMLLQDIE